MQSPRNLAHAYGPQVGQRLLPAVAWFVPLLDHPACHLDLGSSFYRALLGFALMFLGLVREASEAPLGTAQEEHSLRVVVVPLRSLNPVVLIAHFIPASSPLSPLPVCYYYPQTVSSTCPSSEQGPSHSFQFAFGLVQIFHSFDRLDFLFYSRSFWWRRCSQL